MKEITLKVNGEEHSLEVDPRLLLVHMIRENLSLTGTHIGCDTSNCGACTILLDGKSVKSCTIFAVQARGKEIQTVEGLAADGLHPLQEGFKETHGLHCGWSCLKKTQIHPKRRFVGVFQEIFVVAQAIII